MRLSAVRPTSIMGLTKRIAELVVHAIQDDGTTFVTVRFGNVLGSNGSVVPIFQSQIRKGGPVTVTDPDATRFFMTIPEAVQLVLQAASMGQGGEIFVLDMGEQVRIVDLRTEPDPALGPAAGQGHRIVFTGVRPGEKLHEELSAYNEDTLPTHHDKIKIFVGGGSSQRDIPAASKDPHPVRLRDQKARAGTQGIGPRIQPQHSHPPPTARLRRSDGPRRSANACHLQQQLEGSIRARGAWMETIRGSGSDQGRHESATPRPR